MQRYPIELGPIHHRHLGVLSVSSELVAADRIGGVDHTPWNNTERVSHIRDWCALHRFRTTNDSQRDPQEWWSAFLCYVFDPAFRAALLDAKDRAEKSIAR